MALREPGSQKQNGDRGRNFSTESSVFMKPWRKFKGKSLAACEGTFSIYTRQEFWINLNRFNGYVLAFFGSLVDLAL